MHYFDKDWQNDKISEQESEDRLNKYKQNVDKLISTADTLMLCYLKLLDFHDGIIKDLNYQGKQLLFEVILGDNRLGYHNCKIIFEGGNTNFDFSKKLPVCILYEEHMRYGPKYKTTFLLDSNDDELWINFTSISNVCLSLASYEEYHMYASLGYGGVVLEALPLC